MKPAGKKRNHLSELQIERIKLQSYCSYQEQLIGMKVSYLKENYPKILMQSLLPYDKAENEAADSLLDTVNGFIFRLLPGVFKNGKLPAILLKLVEIVMIRAFRRKES
jgi:hypothetical protein